MPIDRLSSAQSLLAALRAEMSQKTEKTGRRDPSPPTREGGGSGAPPDASALRRELTELLRHVPSDDAAAMDAVRPRVVRAVLLWEFGAQLREHPEWQPMLNQLVDTLQSDERHRETFSRLIRDLQR